MAKKAIEIISMSFDAYQNCVKSNNEKWREKHLTTIKAVCDEVMPHGSGLDGEHIVLDIEHSTSSKFVFINLDFHHMNENGYYDGWTEHSAIVKPTFVGFSVAITGRNRNNIKDNITMMLDEALNASLEYSKALDRYVRVEHAVYAIGNGIRLTA